MFILFIAVGATGMVLGHLYFWRRLARDVTRSRRLRLAVLIGLIGLSGLTMLAMALPRVCGREAIGTLVFAGLLWMGTSFYLLIFLGLADLARLLVRLVGRLASGRAEQATAASTDDRPADPHRRRFLARTVAATAVLGSGTIAGLSVRAARSDLTTPEVAVRLSRLPPALSGYRIALLSDIHLGPTLGEAFCRRVVELTNSLKPDVVAITGDLVDGKAELIGPDLAPLADLQARQGVFFTTGNHEYYAGVEQWMAHLPRLGIRILNNEHVELGDGEPGGARFVLAGVPDRQGDWFAPGHGPDPARALAGTDPEREVVLMAHRPSQVDAAVAADVGLQLSGHTHGGQLFPMGMLTRIAEPYLSGLHHHAGRTQVYVTRGTGYWGPPMRVLAPAEITLVVLTT